MTYAETEHEFTDPLTKEKHTLQAGDTLRVLGDDAAFNTAVVRGFDKEGNMLVARPYAYASSTGTMCPTPLVWAEVYSLYADHAARLRPLEKHQRTVKP